MSDATLALGLSAATVLVIFGVFLEGAEFVEEIKKDGWLLRNGLKIAAKLGFMLLVLGLGGEWYFSARIHDRDAGRIKDADDQLTKLQDKGNRLEVENKSLRDDVSTQQKVIKSQNDKTIALEQRLAARFLDKGQSALLTKLVSPYAGELFQIIPYWQDSESFNLAKRISTALTAAHWKLNQPTRFTMLGTVVAGVEVEIDKTSSERTHVAEKSVVSALKRVGIDATLGPENNTPHPSEQVNISVGIKP